MISLDGSNVNFVVAFVAGVMTFFASCLLPLVPTYLAFLAGLSTQEDTRKKDLFKMGLLFTLGFILVFTLLGVGATTVGKLLGQYKGTVQVVGGAFFVVLGLFMLNLIKPNVLLKERKITIPTNIKLRYKWLTGFLVGVFFGFAWTPCIGPVLAVILFWASQASTVLKGMGLMLSFGLGLGVPFLVIAVTFEKIAPFLRKAGKFGKILQYISGIIIIVVGMFLLMGKTEVISIWLIRLLGATSHSF